jgi:hypothetical protein
MAGFQSRNWISARGGATLDLMISPLLGRFCFDLQFLSDHVQLTSFS